MENDSIASSVAVMQRIMKRAVSILPSATWFPKQLWCPAAPPGSDPSENSVVQLGLPRGRMSSLSPRPSSNTEQIASSAPLAPPLPPLCLPVRQRGNNVMESDFRRSDARFLLSPPTMGLKKNDNRWWVQMSFGRCRTKRGPQWLHCWPQRTWVAHLGPQNKCEIEASEESPVGHLSKCPLSQQGQPMQKQTNKQTNHSLSLEMWIQMSATLWACVMGPTFGAKRFH